MDVVVNTVEKAGGSVTVRSARGRDDGAPVAAAQHGGDPGDDGRGRRRHAVRHSDGPHRRNRAGASRHGAALQAVARRLCCAIPLCRCCSSTAFSVSPPGLVRRRQRRGCRPGGADRQQLIGLVVDHFREGMDIILEALRRHPGGYPRLFRYGPAGRRTGAAGSQPEGDAVSHAVQDRQDHRHGRTESCTVEDALPLLEFLQAHRRRGSISAPAPICMPPFSRSCWPCGRDRRFAQRRVPRPLVVAAARATSEKAAKSFNPS